jgi:signal transduction histidine kinase
MPGLVMAGSKQDDASRVRDALFAGIAHDLRNPLNTFAMSTGLLKDDLEGGELDATRALSLVKRMERAAQRMQVLIDDLVVASRIESDPAQAKVEKKSEDVADMAREAVAAATPIVKDRGAEIVVGDVEEGLVASVERTRLVQALVKGAAFVLRTTGEHGRITLTAKKAQDGVELVLRGLNPGGAPASAPGREEGRGGLALLIARAHVLAHGGDLDIRYDDGTKLTITLP